MLKTTLPWPPSANRYWRYWNGRIIINREARDYKKHVQYLSCLWPVKRIHGRIDLKLDIHPPDKRKRDLDNLLKITIDALESTGIFEDDSQIDRILVERKEVIKDGQITVKIHEIKKEGKDEN